MVSSNKNLGNKFETELCDILFEYGFWVHNLAMNQAGQPADIIAVKNSRAYLIDCKVCSHDTFPLSRVEENQRFAMELWRESGNGEGWFALKTKDGVSMISLKTIESLSKEQATLSTEDIFVFGTELKRWIAKCK